MKEDALRVAVETTILRLEKWADYQEKHERELRDMGRFPRSIGPDVPLAKNMRQLADELRRELRPA